METIKTIFGGLLSFALQLLAVFAIFAALYAFLLIGWVIGLTM